MPDGTELDSIDLGTFMTASNLTEKDITSDIEGVDGSLVDGIWKFVFTLAGISQTSYTMYAFRTNDVRKLLMQLAQKNLDVVGFAEAKNLYDKMIYAFEAENYTLTQEIYDQLTDLLEGCGFSIRNCGC
jgi:hypothetical protein